MQICLYNILMCTINLNSLVSNTQILYEYIVNICIIYTYYIYDNVILELIVITDIWILTGKSIAYIIMNVRKNVLW